VVSGGRINRSERILEINIIKYSGKGTFIFIETLLHLSGTCIAVFRIYSFTCMGISRRDIRIKNRTGDTSNPYTPEER
jgi:hypothetical protein